MKHLYIARHAKSSWDDECLDDFERTLNKRGQEAGPKMGAWLSAHNIRPELVICSPATRSRDTLRLFQDGGFHPGQIQYDERLYLASLPQLISIIRAQPASLSSLMLIGHNPGLQNLILELCGDEDDANEGGVSLAAIGEKYPTAAIAHLLFHQDSWADIAPFSGTLYGAVSPKLLANKGAPGAL